MTEKQPTTLSTRNAVTIVLLAAAATYALTMGVRQTMGLFLNSLNTSTGLGVERISLAFAFGQLWWGLTQPFAGAFADRFGTVRVLLLGIALIALGTFITPYMTTTFGLILSIGVLAAGGAGIAGPAVLMTATSRLLPANKRGLANGIVNAGGSFGQFLMAPVAGALIANIGWGNTLQVMAGLALLAVPAALFLKANDGTSTATSVNGPVTPSGAAAPVAKSTRVALREALRTPSFLMLSAGFFVCGFHVAFLATHLPGVVASCGLSAQWGAWALGVLGLFNIAGSITMGWAVGRWRMKSLLSMVYAVRAVAVLAFVLAPKTGPILLFFAAVMGASYLSTVPPTAGLVAKLFGTGNMATLFGLVMLTHQVGAFLGAYLGGKLFDLTGNYNWMWYADIVLAVGAALIHLPIREARLQPSSAQQKGQQSM